ncbi:uncharacterized protein EV420DRAFT_1169199 [Desarmillaria tabescens]|uniref:Uncharacterized protein n=1 Tax=Armillaria tabescens TaxID=1929756 RepID=A0AA39MN15_ARMTA|nr:uncharacterized protein EV420DRAFT_1169199 [Desarmillaria tabescens]KAK0439729.1 hypothetical protein EV420DRAFT_1169199 [Desarmillaria tabescens]
MSPHFKVLGSAEKTLGELFGETSTSACCISFFILTNADFSAGANIHLYNGSSEVAVLKVSCKLGGAKDVMTDVVPNIEKPSEGSKLLDSNDTLDTVLNAVKQMIDVLADVGNILQANSYCLTSLLPRCTPRLPSLGDFCLSDSKWVVDGVPSAWISSHHRYRS